MYEFFYISAAVAIISSLLAVSRFNAVHSLLCMIVSLLAISLIFFILGAPFVAALQVIIYAGAIMVLFVFVIMMLNQGPQAAQQERTWLKPTNWILPALLSLVLLVQLGMILRGDGTWLRGNQVVDPKQVGMAMYGPYILIIELASMLLLAGLVAAFHLARREPDPREGARR